MARPHSILLDVAAGRDFDPAQVTGVVVDSAIDHRMVALLLEATGAHEIPRASRLRLEAVDMSISAYQAALIGIARLVEDRLNAAGVRHLLLKGLIESHRTFPRRSLRPFTDIDLSLAPGASLAAATKALAPDHPQVAVLDQLAAKGLVTAVSVHVHGFSIDIHSDPLRVGPGLRDPELWWHRTVELDLPEVGKVRALDNEASMVAFLIHQARDRFRFLIGAAEYRFRLAQPVDWSGVQELARAEGLWDQVAASARAMSAMLDMPSPVAPPATFRSRVWERLWGPDVRLGGTSGKLQHTRRGVWLMPLLARGRMWESLRWVARSAIPPDDALKLKNPADTGPYLWRLVATRLVRVAQHKATSMRHRFGAAK